MDSNIKSQCNYCSHLLGDLSWETLHFGNIMYKKMECPSCLKEIVFQLNDSIGSGHDKWKGNNFISKFPEIKTLKNNGKIVSLDTKVEIISSKPFSK